MQVLLRQPDHTNKHMNGAANNSKCKQPVSLEKAIYVHHNYLFFTIAKNKKLRDINSHDFSPSELDFKTCNCVFHTILIFLTILRK